jgi:branched-chain amino acid aminotransferase
MLNSEGYVAECTGDNIFIVKNGTLLTPPVHIGFLPGITRGAVMDIAREKNIPALKEILTRYDLFNADECFLTGTAAEIIPVVKIDGRTIADGKPGKTTLTLMTGFHKITRSDGVRC